MLWLAAIRDELRKPAAEPGPVGGPQLIVKKHPHGVHTNSLGHAELAIDATRIVGASLKHLELVHGGRGDIVRAEQPSLRCIPGVGAVSRPSSRLSRDEGQLGQCRGCCQVQRELEGGSPVHHVTIMSVAEPSLLHGSSCNATGFESLPEVGRGP